MSQKIFFCLDGGSVVPSFFPFFYKNLKNSTYFELLRNNTSYKVVQKRASGGATAALLGATLGDGRGRTNLRHAFLYRIVFALMMAI